MKLFSFMYTMLLPDDEQSNRLKHVIEIKRIHYILDILVFSWI
jgi:hypothetical protein